MGMDLYVGPLCRYFARDWETQAAQFSRQNGMTMKTISPDGQIRRAESPLRYRDAMLGWKRMVAPALHKAGADGIGWDERVDAPYDTVQLHWPSLWALRVRAAYCEHPEFQCPEEIPQSALDGFLKRDIGLAMIQGKELASRFANLHACEAWMPFAMRTPAVCEWPTGKVWPLGSVPGFRAEIAALCRSAWGIDAHADAIAARAAEPTTTPLDLLAFDAIKRLLPILQLSTTARLVVVLDY